MIALQLEKSNLSVLYKQISLKMSLEKLSSLVLKPSFCILAFIVLFFPLPLSPPLPTPPPPQPHPFPPL